MPFAAPVRLKPALYLLLAAAVLWLPLSGNQEAGRSSTQPAGKHTGHTVGMSAPVPLAFESATRLVSLPQPERRSPTDALAYTGHNVILTPPNGYEAARQLLLQPPTPGRNALIHWQRLQLEGG